MRTYIHCARSYPVAHTSYTFVESVQTTFYHGCSPISPSFQVRCDCESLKELAALVDFEHVVPRDHALERGAVLFRKEFYDSGLCVDGATGGERSLKAFARDNVVIVEPGSSED